MQEQLDFSTESKLPPANIEAEEAVLGGILLDPEAITRVRPILETAEAFYISGHRDIYMAALALSNDNKPTDLTAIAAWLDDMGLLARVGGRNKLVSLIDRTVSAVNVDYLAELIKEKYTRRQLIKAGNSITKLGYDTAKPLPETVDMSEQQIFSISQGYHAHKAQNTTMSLAELMPEILKQLEGEDPPAIATGFYDLDALLNGGLRRQELVIVAGRPAMGKTLFATNIAYQIAASSLAHYPHKPLQKTLLFSLEMPKDQIGKRLLAAESNLDFSLIRSNKVPERNWPELIESMSRIQSVPMVIDDESNANIFSIRSKIRTAILEAQHLGEEVSAVVVDYLQLMAGVSGDDEVNWDKVRIVGQISEQLKKLARECNVPVIALSQLSRAVESRNNKRPMLSDLRESGEIEQNADIVVMLYRDEYYNSDTMDKSIAEVIVSKQRNGATGTIKLLFDPEHCCFRNLRKS